MDIPSAKPSAGILAKGYRREHSDVVLKGDYVDRDVRSPIGETSFTAQPNSATVSAAWLLKIDLEDRRCRTRDDFQ
jgi:hypothetical protein